MDTIHVPLYIYPLTFHQIVQADLEMPQESNAMQAAAQQAAAQQAAAQQAAAQRAAKAEGDRENKAAVTRGLTDPETIQQLSTSGYQARVRRNIV